MGLFTHKKQDEDQLPEAEAEAVARQTFDAQFQDELRQLGRDHFKQVLDDNTASIRADVDAAVRQIAGDLRDHMQRQLDMTVARINTEITEQLGDRIKEFDKIAAESREAMVRSLNHDTQETRDNYQRLSNSLQQAVAQQEVAMIGVFQDHKTRLSVAQRSQDGALAALTQTAEAAQQQSAHLEDELRRVIERQKSALDTVYDENLKRVEATGAAQTQALEHLQASAQALEEKHQQMSQFLDRIAAEQKAMIGSVINDNMARIIEHYVIGALGEQSDIRTQLPGILRQMEQHKKEMMDDMTL